MTGCIRNHVIMSPSPIRVWLLGAVCVPSAWRRKWKITSRRTIGVIDRTMAGSSVRSVRTPTIVHGTELLSLAAVNARRDGNEDGSTKISARWRHTQRTILPARGILLLREG